MTNPTHSLVTGAAGGIGREIATRLAQEKHNLAIVARTGEKLEPLAADLRNRHEVAVEVIQADLAVGDGAHLLVAELARRGLDIDVLVNKAGFGLFGKHWQTELVDEQQMIDLNVTTLTRLTRLLLPPMLGRRRGHVLKNVARRPLPSSPDRTSASSSAITPG